MHISLSTTFMAVVTTIILMILLSLFLGNQKLMVRVGYKLLTLFVLLTAIRYALPFEFPFTNNIRLPQEVSDIIVLFHLDLFAIGQYFISPWMILVFIWIVGAAFKIMWYTISCLRARYYVVLYGKELTDALFYKALVSRICEEQHRPNRFRVIELPGLDTPMLFGILSPKILIPEHTDLPEDQMYYILKHEMTHHFHHDLLLKSLIKLLTLIYWWNPVCGRLNRQVEVVLEMHVDDVLTASDPSYTSKYLHCLLDYFAGRTNKTPVLSYFTMGMLPEEKSDTVKRFCLLTHNQTKNNVVLSMLMYAIMIFIYLSSYALIFEPFDPPQNKDMDYDDNHLIDIYMPSSSSTYFIDNGDGTYNLFSDGMFLETVDSTEYYPGTPIYTPENNPYQ